MDFTNRSVSREHARWEKAIGYEDPYVSDETVGIHKVLQAHFLIVDYFADSGEGIGGVGPKSLDLLHSALARQFTSFAGHDKWEGIYEKCATIFYGLVKNHPFHDANKRTALLIAIWFLDSHKRAITLPQEELDNFVVAVAEDSLCDYLNSIGKVVPPCPQGQDGRDDTVYQIAEFLRQNTRQTNNRPPTITFRSLDQALRRHRFCLNHPDGNYIDVVRIDEDQLTYLRKVGFPGWKDQVSRGAIKVVREATGLTADNGFDSDAIFAYEEPLSKLIENYVEPLKRLADR